MSYQPTKRMIIDVYTDNIEGKLRVSANTEDEAWRLFKRWGLMLEAWCLTMVCLSNYLHEHDNGV